MVGWRVIEVASTVLPQFNVPDWAPRLVTLLVAFGFPLALITALAAGWFLRGHESKEAKPAQARPAAVCTR